MEELYRYVSGLIKDVKLLGLGTGRTVKGLIDYLHREGLLEGKEIAVSSIDTELYLKSLGYRVRYLDFRPQVYVDGFDLFLEEKGSLIKGGGGAMTREKIVAFNSDYRVYIGDQSKVRGDRIITLPVEVLGFSLWQFLSFMKSKGFEARVRQGQGKMGPVVSDNGNPIVDVEVERDKVEELAELLDSTPGVVEHGYFGEELIDEVAVFKEGLVTVVKQRK